MDLLLLQQKQYQQTQRQLQEQSLQEQRQQGYYTTHTQYMQNRCQTYNQRLFNFKKKANNPLVKPGSPLALANIYMANCQPSYNSNCNLVVYKPSNYQYAKQGAVSSSTRTLKQTVTTIEKNEASIQKTKQLQRVVPDF